MQTVGSSAFYDEIKAAGPLLVRVTLRSEQCVFKKPGHLTLMTKPFQVLMSQY